MSAKILTIDIERQSALVDGVWEGKQHSSWIDPSRIIEPARTICFAYRWQHEDETKFVAEWQGDLDQDNSSFQPGGGHLVMIQKARDLFDAADYVVGFNSKNFDVKHINADIWKYNLLRPAPHVDIDLMHQASRNFQLYARSMKFVAKMKGFEGKVHNESGLWRKLRFATGPELAKARADMEIYNLRDVDQTLEIFYDMRGWLSGMNLGLYVDGMGPVCSNCESDNIQYRGFAGNRSYKYRRFQCQNCGKWGRDAKSFESIAAVGI